MTDPANAASREARALTLLADTFEAEDHELYAYTVRRIRAGFLWNDEKITFRAMLALADEAASQLREGVEPDEAAVDRAAQAMWLTDSNWDSREVWTSLPEYGRDLWRDRARACWLVFHDTAPTDQAQGGRTPEPAPQDNAEIVERCARICESWQSEDASRAAKIMGLNARDLNVARRVAASLAAAIRALATPIQGEI